MENCHRSVCQNENRFRLGSDGERRGTGVGRWRWWKGEESRASEKEGKRKQKFIFIQFTCYMSEQIMVVTNFLLNYCIRKGEMKK
jgi:hypothetical protein